MQEIEIGGRIPPQAVEVEESILGSMLIESSAASTAFELLRGDDFYKPAHKIVFEVMLQLHERNNELDIVTVEHELRDQNQLDAIGGSGYLAQLSHSVTSAANIEYYAQIVIEKSIKRHLITDSTEIIQKAFDSTTDAYELLDSAEQKMFDLANAKTTNSGEPISNILRKTLDYLVEIRDTDGGLTGVPTSMDIDKMTSGWQNGDLIIIAARPSMGKTAFTLTCARNAALHHIEKYRTAVAFFSLEMSSQSLVQRLLTMESRVNAQRARSGQLNDEEFQKLVTAAGMLIKAPIFIDDTPSISMMELRSKSRRLKKEHNIGLIIIDYLQLMTGGKSDISREQEIAYISRSLKALAKELNVPVIALSQLSRAVEQRAGSKRPQLSDLRESGSIEQDADVVCFLYRPEYYGINTLDNGQPSEGIAEIIIGKQRNGPVGAVPLYFIKEYARFENPTRIYESSLPPNLPDQEPNVGQPQMKPQKSNPFSDQGQNPNPGF